MDFKKIIFARFHNFSIIIIRFCREKWAYGYYEQV